MNTIQMMEHLMLAQVEIIVVPAGEGEDMIDELTEYEFDVRPIGKAIYTLIHTIRSMNTHGLTPAILVTEEEGASLVAESMRYIVEFLGVIVIKNELVTDGMRFNSHHVEVLEDFTILYH